MPGHKPAAPRPVQVFLAHLREAPLGDWLMATMHVSSSPAVREARSALDTVLTRALDHSVIFGVEDEVFDALHRFESAEGRRLMRIRHSTDHLRSATEQAALAVLARNALSDSQFGALYGKFESIVPAVLLFGLNPT